jgi:hypothetical protein
MKRLLQLMNLSLVSEKIREKYERTLVKRKGKNEQRSSAADVIISNNVSLKI